MARSHFSSLCGRRGLWMRPPGCRVSGALPAAPAGQHRGGEGGELGEGISGGNCARLCTPSAAPVPAGPSRPHPQHHRLRRSGPREKETARQPRPAPRAARPAPRAPGRVAASEGAARARGTQGPAAPARGVRTLSAAHARLPPARARRETTAPGRPRAGRAPPPLARPRPARPGPPPSGLRTGRGGGRREEAGGRGACGGRDPARRVKPRWRLVRDPSAGGRARSFSRTAEPSSVSNRPGERGADTEKVSAAAAAALFSGPVGRGRPLPHPPPPHAAAAAAPAAGLGPRAGLGGGRGLGGKLAARAAGGGRGAPRRWGRRRGRQMGPSSAWAPRPPGTRAPWAPAASGPSVRIRRSWVPQTSSRRQSGGGGGGRAPGFWMSLFLLFSSLCRVPVSRG